jgi:TM2 domain-containing membrane protein YozV
MLGKGGDNAKKKSHIAQRQPKSIVYTIMKNKTVAGILALVAGYIGLHRFYLGQVGMGLTYIILLPVFLMMGLWFYPLIGLVDAIALFSMDQDKFDDKYNKDNPRERAENRPPASSRGQQRNDRYQDRQAQRSTRSTAKRTSNKANPHLKVGKEKFNDYEYEAAIREFDKALSLDPQSIPAHFNLACAHSLMEHKDQAFYHLDRAVALGFDDFEAIRTRDHLAYIRIQEEYLQFEANNFRLAKQLKTPQENLLDQKPPAAAPEVKTDLLQQLQQLANLKEKGLLTEAEFNKQKEKLLR